MLQTIHRTLGLALEGRGLDWRSCFSLVRSEPPDGRIVTVECSDARILEDIRAALPAAGIDSSRVRLVCLPDSRSSLPERFVVSASVADLRKEPSHAAELLTQAIAGDGLLPLKRSGDWVLVRMDDGYHGWVRNWHLNPISNNELNDFMREARFRVLDNVIRVVEAPDEGSLPVCDAVAGTALVARECRRRGWRAVSFADGRSGFTKTRYLERVPTRRRVSREKLGKTGLRFLGIPYVWGGTTSKGFDCSGLIQRVFRLHGVLLPRDADLQSRYGREKAVGRAGALRTGDLLFFGKNEMQIAHVAMYLSNGLFLHARGHVRVNALDSLHPLFDGKLVGEWCRARDPLSR
ncbi:MAG: C40 family peptidase [bacterium]